MALKFKTEYINHTIPHDHRIEELKYWCHTFQDMNLTPLYENRSLGNLSFRLHEYDDAFIITASALALKEGLQDDAFVMVHSYDMQRGIVFASGAREPSMESMLHFGVYQARKDVNAVFHGHSGRILHTADALRLPTTEKFEDHGSVQLVDSVLAILRDHTFVVMKDHGFLSLGANMAEAGRMAIELHERARNLREKKSKGSLGTQTQKG